MSSGLPYHLHLADCLGQNGLSLLPDNCIDMVLCDPPYGVTSRNDWDVPLDLVILFKELDRIVKPNSAVIFFSQGMLTADLMKGPWSKYWRYNLVWKKNKPRGFLNAKKMPLRYHEDIVVFYKSLPTYNPQMIESGKPIHYCNRKSTSINYGHSEGGVNERTGKTDRYPGSVLEFPVVNEPTHPTEKPVELCEFLIKSYSKEGDIILDMCAGSGTTGIASIRSNRRFIGYETQEVFHKQATDKINQLLIERYGTYYFPTYTSE